MSKRLRIAVIMLSLTACLLLVVAIWTRISSVSVPLSSIPLSSILSTSGQEEMQGTTSAVRMIDGEKEYVVPTGEALQRFFEVTKGNGATNIFLVDAPNDVSAIAVSATVFAGYRSVGVPVTLNQSNPPRGNHWLVVSLGVAGSSPTRWLVDSVTVNQGKIRFSYHKNAIGISTADIHNYFYWVPLGTCDYGVYYLELYETNLEAVTLSRRVEIQPPRQKKRR
jgi:hypothetical protein